MEITLMSAPSVDRDRDASDRCKMVDLEASKYLMEDHRSVTQLSKEDLIKLGSPAHTITGDNPGTDVLKEKPIRIEILEPEVKEILATCDLYNLDQVRTQR